MPEVLIKELNYLLTRFVLHRVCSDGHRGVSIRQIASSVKTTVYYWTGFVLPPCYWPPQCHRLLKVQSFVWTIWSHLPCPAPSPALTRRAAVALLSVEDQVVLWRCSDGKRSFSWLCLSSREPESSSPAPSLTSPPRRPLTSRWVEIRITNGSHRLKEGNFTPIKLQSS